MRTPVHHTHMILLIISFQNHGHYYGVRHPFPIASIRTYIIVQLCYLFCVLTVLIFAFCTFHFSQLLELALFILPTMLNVICCQLFCEGFPVDFRKWLCEFVPFYPQEHQRGQKQILGLGGGGFHIISKEFIGIEAMVLCRQITFFHNNSGKQCLCRSHFVHRGTTVLGQVRASWFQQWKILMRELKKIFQTILCFQHFEGGPNTGVIFDVQIHLAISYTINT